MVSSITTKMAADQPLVYNSELIPALPGRTYTFTPGPIRSRGQRYAAYLLAIPFSAKVQELGRYVRWIGEADDASRRYALTFRTPPETSSILLGYRVNAETPLRSAFEVEMPAELSADMLAVTDGVPERYERLTDHLDPVFLRRIRNLVDTDSATLETDLEVIHRRLEENNARDTWNRGIEPEADHWRNYLRRVKGDAKEPRLDPTFPLKSVFTQLLNTRSRKPVRILDVGAGPLSMVGKVWPGRQVCLVPVDPLAPLYDQALAEAGIVPPVRTIYAEAEKLTSFFEPDSFDLVVCSNALDHCYNPFKALDEMLHVVKPGGSVLLLHIPNEAENECYSGFHQWNFWDYKGNFVAWNRKGIYVVNRIFADRARCSVTRGNQLIVILRKHGPAGLRGSLTIPVAATRRIFGAAFRAAQAAAAASWQRPSGAS